MQRLFYDTVKGGDFRCREANVYRLAEVSVDIIDQMVAQGVPFAREYGGLLDNRSFGGAQVSPHLLRPRPDRPAAPARRVPADDAPGAGRHGRAAHRTEMLDLVVKDGVACGIIVRDLVTGQVTRHSPTPCCSAPAATATSSTCRPTPSTRNVTASWRAHRRGAVFANPCYTQIHPTCIPASDEFQSKLTLMSESLRNDGRIWVPKDPDETAPDQIPEEERDYFLERKYPSFGNLVPRDVASRNAKTMVDQGRGVGPLKNGVYLDFATPSAASARHDLRALREPLRHVRAHHRRGPVKVPMRIYPAVHYTMGGLWVDYHLMSNVPGLFVLGEANFSDHGANRLGASALMQGLADGYFVISYTLGQLPGRPARHPPVPIDDPAFAEAEQTSTTASSASCRSAAPARSTTTTASSARSCGTTAAWPATRPGLEKALSEIPALREEFWKDVRVLGDGPMNQSLEKAGRVADFFELGELMVRDALAARSRAAATSGRRARPRTARRSATTSTSATSPPGSGPARAAQTRHTEPLTFEAVHLTQRSYK